MEAEEDEMVEVHKDSVEALADNLITVALAFEKLTTSGLNERAIVLLVQDATGVRRDNIRAVIHAVKNLDKMYLAKEG